MSIWNVCCGCVRDWKFLWKDWDKLSKFYATIYHFWHVFVYQPPCVCVVACVCVFMYMLIIIYSQQNVKQIICFWYKTISFGCSTLNVWFLYFLFISNQLFSPLCFDIFLAVKLIYFRNVQNQYLVCKLKRLFITFALNGSVIYLIETLYKYICSTEISCVQWMLYYIRIQYPLIYKYTTYLCIYVLLIFHFDLNVRTEIWMITILLFVCCCTYWSFELLFRYPMIFRC